MEYFFLKYWDAIVWDFSQMAIIYTSLVLCCYPVRDRVLYLYHIESRDKTVKTALNDLSRVITLLCENDFV